MGDGSFYGNWEAIDTRNDRISVAGPFMKEQSVLAYLTQRESLLDLDMNDLTSCFFSDTTNEHVTVPLSIMSTEDLPVTTFDASPLWTWTNADTLIITDVTPPTFSDLCSLL